MCCSNCSPGLLDDFSSEKNIELFIVARLGLKGVECLRTAAVSRAVEFLCEEDRICC